VGGRGRIVSPSQPGNAPILLRGGHVVTSRGLVDADVRVEAGRIAGVGADLGAAGGEVLDAGGLVVAPGFIDLQVNGAHGIDVTSEPERLWEVGASLPRYGVTGFLPTVVTAPPATTARALEALAGGPPPGWSGAVALGLHLEGPMLNSVRKGAHNADHLRLPSPEVVEGWSRDAGVALVTLAPEVLGALEVVELLAARGVVVSAGHTDADADITAAAVAAGARYITHLFNAMAPFHHREPGPAGVALTDERLVVGLIADGVHVHPVAVAAVWRALGPDRLNLVTDAVAALGLPPGPSCLGDLEVFVNDDGIRLADGTLAGSNLSLDEAVRNLVAFTGCGAHEAIATVTSTPARLLGLPEKGVVGEGADADLTVLTPELEVAATIVAGRLLHSDDARVPWRS
jgi:N-acetylglucosamine-6-phosphate deacetylase